ncbi:odorant receptor 47a-like [Diachasma alloeum]|uniref:Odorant receptor n=1 Tax=Diachasma alloeum TaxID=454923 RepID=A0A4E0RL73_9HYME|nr:odorant receptor 47a-like [Diachasma alloeum]THK32879.1 odorant receptor 175 [Diachasma alloeum]
MNSAKKIVAEEIKLQEYHGLTRLIKCYLFLCGAWPISHPGILYRALSIYTIISNLLGSITLFRFTFANVSSISQAVRGFSLGSSCISLALKDIQLTYYMKESYEILTTLHNYFKESLLDKNLRYCVLDRVTSVRRLTLIHFFIVTSGACMFAFVPIIRIILQTWHGVQPVKYTLPAPALYPWKIYPGGMVYKITYIYEMYNMLCLATITVGVDCLFAYYIFLITGQFRVLSHQMVNLQSSEDHDEFIRKWVDKFLVLRQCCRKLQKMYGPIILWQITTNAAVICAILFQISQGKGIPVAAYIQILCYSGGKIVQTFIYSSSGTILTEESELGTQSAYFCDWPDAVHHRFRTAILIILTQEPLKVSVANWIIVSNELFVMTLNAAVSYYFLLQTFEEKQS